VTGPEHYLVACAIFRDEAPFLAEWIEFHRLVGVQHIFLYDNGSEDQPERVLAPFVDEGCVTLQSWPIPFHLRATHKAYADCLERARGRARWLAFLDLDEFLFSPRAYRLDSVLREFEEYPGVVVRWQVYGSSGELHASPEPVISRFNRRAPTGWIRNRSVKSIVDPSRALRPVGVHHFAYRDGKLAVTESREPVRVRERPRLKKYLRPLYRLLGPAVRYVDPYVRNRFSSRTVSVDLLRINHYPVKSREEFLRKARFKREKRRYDGID
jgi:Glycosyltransferase family 92